MFPLKERKLIRGCLAHQRAGLGCGADYVAQYVKLYAPTDGIATTFYGRQGGNWIRLRLLDGSRIEFAHLSTYKKLGKVQEGDIIAVTGNTGAVTTGPHLHVQIFDKNNKRLDPEKYNWNTMDYKKLYEQEKKDHAESIKQKDLNYQKWQDEIDKRKECEEVLDQIKSLLSG